MSHFLYELQRAAFGPFTELANIYYLVDSRSAYFMDKFQEINDKIGEKKVGKKDCSHGKEKRLYTSLPIWCDECSKFTANLNLVSKHFKCLECNKNTCSACFIRSG